MIETKILEVQEDERQNVVNDMQWFGWQVLSSQKIDYTTTYKTGGGNAKSGYYYTVHNDRTAYYSITFQRDTSINNYSKINNLYSEYEEANQSAISLLTKMPKKSKIIYVLIGSIVAFAISFFVLLIISIFDFDLATFLIMFFFMCFPWLVALIISAIISNRANKKYNTLLNEVQDQLDIILKKRSEIVDDAKSIMLRDEK